jgi:hypothetical protein
MHDRHVHREVARALDCSAHQAPDDLGEGREHTHETLVENRHAGWLQNSPAGCQWESRRLIFAMPWAQQVALSQQLGTEPFVDPDTADEQAVQDKQAEAVAELRGVLRDPASG